MAHPRSMSMLRLAGLLCLAALLATGTHAQVIRTGGGSCQTGGPLESACESSDAAPTPTAFQLLPGYPNPFNPSVTFDVELREAADVRLDVYTVLGQRVRVLAAGRWEAGRYAVRWDARDDRSAELPGGTYLVRLTAEHTVQTQAVTLLK